MWCDMLNEVANEYTYKQSKQFHAINDLKSPNKEQSKNNVASLFHESEFNP
jgi:hypothetical protein